MNSSERDKSNPTPQERAERVAGNDAATIEAEIRAAVEAERESCARAGEAVMREREENPSVARNIIYAIRARSTP